MEKLIKVCRFGDLKLKAIKLEEQAQTMTQAVNNMLTLRGRSNEWINLYNNNEQLKLGFAYIFAVSGNSILPSFEQDYTIRTFADMGDPLCKKINNHLNNMEYPLRNLMVRESSVPEKILTRSMTEKEYNGMLEGSIPFSSYVHDYNFLPKD